MGVCNQSEWGYILVPDIMKECIPWWVRIKLLCLITDTLQATNFWDKNVCTFILTHGNQQCVGKKIFFKYCQCMKTLADDINVVSDILK